MAVAAGDLGSRKEGRASDALASIATLKAAFRSGLAAREMDLTVAAMNRRSTVGKERK